MSAEKTKEDYEDALRWVFDEVIVALSNKKYTKETLIVNIRDRVSAALAVGPYAPRDEPNDAT